jgi:class 3 adenylate cyclase
MFADGSHGVLLMREDSAQNIWLSGAGYHGVMDIAKNWRPMPFLSAGLDEVWALQADRDGVVWAFGPDGHLIRAELTRDPAAEPFRMQIRRLQAGETRRTLFGGFGKLAAPPRLSHEDNDLRVEFAAPFFDAPERVEYQFSMDTAGGRWSSWTNETWKDLNNLWEGSYEFRVRARNPYGQMTPEATLFFRIQAPWYRTWWAYVLYVVGAAGVIWQFLRWRYRKLRESNRRLEALVDERTAQIKAQEQRTEALLLNILPAPVAEELRSTGEVTPHHFDDVTVCFTDFVGFTLSSEKLPARELVTHLHRYFTEFDNIVARYGLEKLKTIGDAYMFVAGLPEENPAHAVNAVLAAMEILARAKELSAAEGGMPWKLRIGLHSGPVVAGVVGVKKFAFDIWGDTVNLASRMESSGVPNRVNLSAATYARVRNVIECEARGPVRTKDGRDLEMYFANGLAMQPVPNYSTAFQTPPKEL